MLFWTGFTLGFVIFGAVFLIWKDTQLDKIKQIIETKYQSSTSSYFLGREDQKKEDDKLVADCYVTIGKQKEEIEKLLKEVLKGAYENGN